MSRPDPTSVRLDPEVKAALEQAALADDRSISNLIERICRGWLEQRGLLGQPVPKPTKATSPARKPARLKMLEPRIAVLDTRTAKPPKGG